MSEEQYDKAFTSAISHLPLSIQKYLQIKWRKAKRKYA